MLLGGGAINVAFDIFFNIFHPITALRLGRWFKMESEFWLNLQKSYELKLAQKELGQEIEASITRIIQIKGLDILK